MRPSNSKNIDKSLLKQDIAHRTFSEQPDKYFLYFIADTPQQEKDLWHSFLAWLEHLPDQYSVYHYADYEHSHLNSLAEKYGDSAARQSFMSHLIDLDKVVQQSVVLPLYSYTLKDIAKSDLIGFQWRHEKAGGGTEHLMV